MDRQQSFKTLASLQWMPIGRGLAAKRLLAPREFVSGIEALERSSAARHSDEYTSASSAFWLLNLSRLILDFSGDANH